jgi:hypothetical protein
MIDRVRLVQDLRGNPLELPNSIPYMQHSVEIRVNDFGHVTYSFNVPKLERGKNDVILPASRDIQILRQVIEDFSGIDSRLRTSLDQWSVQYWELAENRQVRDPLQFTRAVAESALDLKGASVKNFDGFLRTLAGPKRRRTRIYAKSVGNGHIIRHENVCERGQIEADFRGRKIETAIEYLESCQPKNRLDESWEKYAARFEDYDPVVIFKKLQAQRGAVNAACPLDKYFLARSLLGSRGAMDALGISPSTVDRYNRQIREVGQAKVPTRGD